MTIPDRFRRYVVLVPTLLALAAYLLTVCRSIWIGDGAEFALALKTLGICHPPGYPLFTISGSIVVQALAFLRPVFAANLYTVCCTAAAVGVLFTLLRRDISDIPAAVLGLVWAFTPGFWAQASGVEVYNTNLLVVLLTLLALQSNLRYKWPLTLYLFGLALCGHPSSLALAPVILYWYIREREYLHWQKLPIYLGLVALAGTMYLYLWVRAANGPISDWGHPVGLSALWHHMSLKQYSGWVLESSDSLAMTVRLYARSVIESWWWFGVAAALSGAYLGIRFYRRRTITAILLLVTSLALATFHQAVDYAPFFLIPTLATLLLMSNNIVWMKERGIKNMFISAGGLVAIGAMLFFHFPSNNVSGYNFYEDYSKLILETVDRGILFTAGDFNSFGPMYLRYAEGYRPGVEVFDRSIRRHALLEKASTMSGQTTDDYFAARTAIFHNERRQIYLVKNHAWGEPEWLPGSDSLHSYGILYELMQTPNRTPRMPAYPAGFDIDDPMTRGVLANLDLAGGEEKLAQIPRDSLGALTSFREAIGRMKNEPRGIFLNFIGSYLRRIGQGDMALDAYQQALQKPILTATQRKDIIFNISNVYKDRGNLAHQHGDYLAAVAAYIEALKYDPASSRTALNIGLIYLQNLNDPANARTYLNKYLELVPSDTRVRNLLNSLN
jgi:hypothetical protein